MHGKFNYESKNCLQRCIIVLPGVLVFALPLTLHFIDLKYSAPVVCTVAIFAAIQEGHYIRTGKEDI